MNGARGAEPATVDRPGLAKLPASDAAAPCYRLIDVSFRPVEGWLQVAGQTHTLTPLASSVLHELVQAHPRALRREALLDRLWGPDRGSPEALAQVITELRRKLGDDARDPTFIRTVNKVGFQLLPQPQAQEPPTSAPDAGTAFVGPPRADMRRWWSRRGRMALALALASLGLLAAWLLHGPAGDGPISTPTTEPLLLANDALIETMPRLQAGSDRLVYVRRARDGGNADLVLRRLQQVQVQALGATTADELSPVLSADGRQLAFVRQSGADCAVILANPDSGAERTLARCAPGASGSLLDMSADGRWLAYTAPTDASQARAIEVIAVADGQRRQRSDASTALHTDHAPRLAADGRSFSFLRHDFQTGEIRLRLQQDTDSRELTAPAGERYLAHAWSPAGRLYALATGALSTRLVEIDLVSGAARSIIDRVPEGRHLAYDGERFVYATAFVRDTHIARFDFGDDGQTASQRLTSARAAHRLPRLSPDGQTLLFAASSGEGSELWAHPLHAKADSRLGAWPDSSLLSLAWHPDGASLYLLLQDQNQQAWLLQLSYPGAQPLARNACPDASAIGLIDASGRVLLRDAAGRLRPGCAASAETEVVTSAVVLQAAPDGRLYGSLEEASGIWELDPGYQPLRQLTPYQRGVDFAWDLRPPWFVSLQLVDQDPNRPQLQRIDLRDGSERRIDLPQLDPVAGVEIGADGHAYAVLNEFANVDIIMLRWREVDRER